MFNLGAKILFWVAAAAGGAALLYGFLSMEGMTAIEFLGREYSMRTSVFLALAGVFFALIWFALYLVRAGFGGIAGVFDFFSRSRHRKGLNALAKAMVALEEGDGKRAMAAAAKAERLLDNPDLTRLVNARAAEMAGASLRAERYYEAMALDEDTEFLGVRGLMRRALQQKKPERALKLAERAALLRPKEPETLDTMLMLTRQKGDWSGARKAIEAQVRGGRLTRDVGDRRKAVLLLTDAQAKDANGAAEEARRMAQSAAKLAPGLAPAAALSAKLSLKAGEKRGAARTLITAWSHAPHPEIAEAYAALAPDETADARLRRFERLFSANPRAVDTKLLEAELSIAAGKYVRAREAIDAALTAGPSAQAYALMAALEQAEDAPETTVRAMLAKAAAAPRGAQWVCENCGAASAHWTGSCHSCGAFDTLSWRVFEEGEENGARLSDALLLPLMTPRPANGADASAEKPTTVENGADAKAIEGEVTLADPKSANGADAAPEQRPN